MKATIKVTEDHISTGIRRHNRLCPIAKAIYAHYPKSLNVLVDCDFVYTHEFMAALPSQARNFMDRFDFYHLVTPFTFEVNWQPRPHSYKISSTPDNS